MREQASPPTRSSRIEVEAAPGLWLLPRGGGSADATARADVLASLLLGDARTVVADCGVGPVGAARVGGRRGVGLVARGSSLLCRAAARARRPAASLGCRARERTGPRTRREGRRRRARCAGSRRGHRRSSRRSGGRRRLARQPPAALTRTCTAEGGMSLADDVEARVHHQLLEGARPVRRHRRAPRSSSSYGGRRPCSAPASSTPSSATYRRAPPGSVHSRHCSAIPRSPR